MLLLFAGTTVFVAALVTILLGSAWRELRCRLLSSLSRFEVRVASSEECPVMASVSAHFMGSLALAAAMAIAFFSLIFFRLSFNFACLAFCLARTRVQLVRKKRYSVFGRTLNFALRDKVVPSPFGCASVADLASTVRMSSSGLNSIASSCMRVKRPR